MFRIEFGHAGHTATAPSEAAAVAIADALMVKGWLRIRVFRPDGTLLPWKVR